MDNLNCLRYNHILDYSNFVLCNLAWIEFVAFVVIVEVAVFLLLWDF